MLFYNVFSNRLVQNFNLISFYLTFHQKGCALANFPGVYAGVSVFADWIRTKLGAKYTPSEDDEIYMDIVKDEIQNLPIMEPATPISKPTLPIESRIVSFASVWPYYHPYNFYPTFKPSYMRPIYPNTFYWFSNWCNDVIKERNKMFNGKIFWIALSYI